MITMSDQDERVAFLCELYRFYVNLGHKRAGRVNYPQFAMFTGFPNLRRDSMGAVDNALAIGHLFYAVHKNRTLAL